MERYSPEIGQLAFGCPTSQYACPEFVEAGLAHLANEIERVLWNTNQKTMAAPTENNGSQYATDAFEMRAYYWGDDKTLASLPNFRCGDFEVRWYKFLGRGMSMNKEIDANAFFELIEKCLTSVRLQDVPYEGN